MSVRWKYRSRLDLHYPEAGDTEDDLECSEKAADASEFRVRGAAAHVCFSRRQHEDVAYSADAREGSQEDVKGG